MKEKHTQPRSQDVLIIGIVGAESSGKTTLARALARWYQSVWVEEYARSYLEAKGAQEEASDLVPIAKGQAAAIAAAILEAKKKKKRLVVCDTTQLVMRIWAEVGYGFCPPALIRYWQKEQMALYLLCAPDIPWQADPLRSMPDPLARAALCKYYKTLLDEAKRPYLSLYGCHQKRLMQATQAIDQQVSTTLSAHHA